MKEGKTLLRVGLMAALTVTLVTLAGPLWAGEDDVVSRLTKLTKSESLTIGGKAYVRYWYDIRDTEVEDPGDDEAHLNSFELWRAYFGIKARITPWLKMRFTTDVGADKPGKVKVGDDEYEVDPKDTRYGLYVKYAWFDARLVEGLHLRAGIVDHPYHGFTDDFWGYRYVFKNIGDEEKLWNSADLGAYLRWLVPADLGEVTLGVMNGAGYKHALDEDSTKDLNFHFLVRPLSPVGDWGRRFALAACLRYPLTMADDEDRELFYSAFAGYAHDWVTLGYQAVGNSVELADDGGRTAGLGHALYFRFDTPWQVGLLSRVVIWDADTDDDAVLTTYQALAGLSFTPSSFLSLAASGVKTWTTEHKDADPAEEEIKLLLSSQLKF